MHVPTSTSTLLSYLLGLLNYRREPHDFAVVEPPLISRPVAATVALPPLRRTSYFHVKRNNCWLMAVTRMVCLSEPLSSPSPCPTRLPPSPALAELLRRHNQHGLFPTALYMS